MYYHCIKPILLQYFSYFNCILNINYEFSTVPSVSTLPLISINENNIYVLNYTYCPGIVIYGSLNRLIDIVQNIENQIRVIHHIDYTRRKYLLISNDENKHNQVKIFNSPAFKFLFDVLLITNFNNCCTYYENNYSNWSVNRDNTVILNKWCYSKLGFEDNNNSKFQMKFNTSKSALSGRTLNVSVHHIEPYTNLKTSHGGELSIILSFCATYEMVCQQHVEPDRWGTVYSLTNGTGMRFSIATGKAEVAFGSMLPKPADRIYGQILDATVRCSVQFLVTQPEPISGGKYLTIPFSNAVWIVCGVIYFLIVVIAYLGRRKIKANVDVSKVFLVIFRVFVQQPTTIASKLLLFLVFGSMVLSAYYSSTYSSLIIKPIYENNLETLADVIKAKNINIISADIDYKDIIEKKSIELGKIFIPVAPEDFINYINDNYKRAIIIIDHLDSGYSFVDYNNYITVDMLNNFHLMREEVSVEFYGMQARKQTTLAPFINEHIMWVSETGLYTYWLEEAQREMEYRVQLRMKLGLHNRVQSINKFPFIIGCIELLGVGLTLSFIVFIIEIVCGRMTRLTLGKKQFVCYCCIKH